MCGKAGGMFLVLLVVGGFTSLSPHGESATLKQARASDPQAAPKAAPRMPAASGLELPGGCAVSSSPVMIRVGQRMAAISSARNRLRFMTDNTE